MYSRNASLDQQPNIVIMLMWNDSFSTGVAETLEAQELAGVHDELLEVQGVAPGKKAEGTTRLMYENVDGLQNRIGGMRSYRNARI